ncbi:MAG: phenylalanine--tRNA ligase subunit beta [Bacteroidota bacterium]
MKISYNWLRQYHNLDLSPDKVAVMLTGCGLEVEGQETFQSVKGGLKGVVIGEVMTCEKHPNSDHLSVTTVNAGGPELLRIVCGASNVAQGQKVVVATLGTTLYFDDRELTLQRTKIRGEVSEGMICAEDELGLGTSHAGIMVLDPEAPVGTAAADYFGIEEDIVFTIGLTPNRADAASHTGVARDLVAVANNFGLNESAAFPGNRLALPDVSAFKVDNDGRHIDVIIEDMEACPRYTGITLSGIRVGGSPDWLKNRIMAIGLRPINNIVDITNFILMELGQPLHAFDADRITGQKVVVKKYPKGTKFITLDSAERELSGNDLMICNTAEPMCIAGVFGGLGSGVSDETVNIFLESACFDPKHVRKTSRFHGLQTDASFRFERGTNPDITVYALKRAALMIKEIAGGEISSEIVDVYPVPFPPVIVDLSFGNLDRLIGKKLNREVVKNILEDLGIEITGETTSAGSDVVSGLQLTIPAFKVDVTREADVIEEILRIYGYNNIEIPSEVKSSLSFTSGINPERIQNLIADYLAANGFTEIMNNSLTKSTYYQGNPDFPVERCVKMLNPISRDLDVMRQTLLFGALETIVHNQNRKSADLKMFEFGRVYSLTGNNDDPVTGYHEEKHLAILVTGRLQPENWNTRDEQVDFFELKGYLGAILKKLAVPQDKLKYEPCKTGLVTDGLVCGADGKQIFLLGFLAGPVLKSFDFRQPVLYAEVNWDNLLKLVPVKNARYSELPKFPEVRRDLALLVDKAVTFEQIEQLAFQTEKKLLEKVGLFDVYEGDKLATGKKSYAVSFILQDKQKTLTVKEIEKAMERILKGLVNGLNAQLR